MIELFTVENYRSYKKEETLSFIASNKEKGSDLPPAWYKEINGKRILRLLLCVGLNGTGKSKMFSALSYLQMIATCKPESPTDKPEYRPFLLDDESKIKPTVLSLTYYLGEVSYCYKVSVSSERIEEEELRVVTGNILVYNRWYNSVNDTVGIKYGPGCDLKKEDRRVLEKNVIQNSTVLAVFGGMNISSSLLRQNYDFFAQRISLVRRSDQGLEDRLQTGDQERDKRVKKLLLKLLKDVGTNIVDYEVDEASLSIDELVKSGAPEMLVKVMREQYPSGVITHKNLHFIHSTASQGNRYLDARLESLGTLNIIRVLVVMYDIVMGRKSSCIDEIEYGIHTKALAFILKMYLSIAEDCQVAVATHDLSLLGQPGLRRDAVRKFEKDENGCTHVRKAEYVHNTMSFLRQYNKMLDPKLDALMENVNLFDEYKDLVNEFLSDLYGDRSVKNQPKD